MSSYPTCAPNEREDIKLQIGRIESAWRYPVKGMRGEEIPHTYTAYTGLMGDRVYGVVAADGDPSLASALEASFLASTSARFRAWGTVRQCCGHAA